VSTLRTVTVGGVPGRRDTGWGSRSVRGEVTRNAQLELVTNARERVDAGTHRKGIGYMRNWNW